VGSYRAKQLHLKTTIIASLSILILSKTYPTKVTSSHVGLWLGGLFCQKAAKIMDPYFQYFSSVSSEVIITKWAIDTHKNCTTQLIHTESSHSSIITGYHGQLIKQSRITVRGRQSIDSYTLQGNLNTRSGAPQSWHRPNGSQKSSGWDDSLQSWVQGYLECHTQCIQPHTRTLLPVASRAGDESRLVVVKSCTVSLRY
jgi:hypothetical protein